MKRPLLLEFAYASIEEIIQAKQQLSKEEILKDYPQLAQKLQTTLRIYIDNKLSKELTKDKKVIDNIIDGAKELAFIEGKPLLLREYLACEIEIEIDTPKGKLTHRA